MPKVVKSCQKLPKDAKSCQKLPKVVKNCQKLSKVVKSRQKLSKVAKSCPKFPKAAKSRQKLPKVVNSCQKLPKVVKNCQKLPKVAKSWQMLPKLPKVAKCCQKLHSALYRCPLVNAAGSLFHMHLHRKYNLLLHACRAKAVLKILSGSGNPAVQANYFECCRLTVHKMSPCTQVKLSVQMWIKRSRVFILYAPPQKIQPFSACLPGESRAFAVQCGGNPEELKRMSFPLSRKISPISWKICPNSWMSRSIWTEVNQHPALIKSKHEFPVQVPVN